MAVESRTRVVYDDSCLPVARYGCMALDAINYDATATEDDGSCEWGCDAKTEVYTKNDCPTGQTASTYTLKVEESEYVSSVNKADANSLRDTDMAIRGQSLANELGTCTPPVPSESGTVNVADCEYQRPNPTYGSPGILKIKLDRDSINGTSAISGQVEVYEEGTETVVANPVFSISSGSNCRVVMSTAGLVEFSSYRARLIEIEQSNYSIIGDPVPVRKVDLFSTTIDCPA